MRMSNIIREQCLWGVMRDQYLEELKRMNDEFIELAKKNTIAKYGDLSSELDALAEKHNLDKDLFCGKNKSAYLYDGRDEMRLSVGVYAFKKDTPQHFWSLSRSFQPGIFMPRTQAWGEVRYTLEFLGLEEKYQEIVEFVKTVRKMHDDLAAVLLSVNSVKQLQDNTKIFDPWIQTKAATTALMPAESLCRINELKSPKE